MEILNIENGKNNENCYLNEKNNNSMNQCINLVETYDKMEPEIKLFNETSELKIE